MIKAGIRVPPGFAVTTDSYQGFIEKTGIDDAIIELTSGLDVEDMASLNRASEAIGKLMDNAAMPEDMRFISNNLTAIAILASSSKQLRVN